MQVMRCRALPIRVPVMHQITVLFTESSRVHYFPVVTIISTESIPQRAEIH
uniref:Uncharacterized protein n=1 Tax=Anguilla anguilla TaxID=7936 RepID=A0A0E9SFM0_ANGAN